MSHKNDVKNALIIFEKFGKKQLEEKAKVKILKKETNWGDQKIQTVMKTITEEAVSENAE